MTDQQSPPGLLFKQVGEITGSTTKQRGIWCLAQGHFSKVDACQHGFMNPLPLYSLVAQQN